MHSDIYSETQDPFLVSHADEDIPAEDNSADALENDAVHVIICEESLMGPGHVSAKWVR